MLSFHFIAAFHTAHCSNANGKSDTSLSAPALKNCVSAPRLKINEQINIETNFLKLSMNLLKLSSAGRTENVVHFGIQHLGQSPVPVVLLIELGLQKANLMLTY